YIRAAGIATAKGSPLFRSARGKTEKLTENGMSRTDVLKMIKRRASKGGLPGSTCCHTFRGTGITAFLENGSTIQHAQAIAGHESPRTTKLYDRTDDSIPLMKSREFAFKVALCLLTNISVIDQAAFRHQERLGAKLNICRGF